jgi:hypothetical protein
MMPGPPMPRTSNSHLPPNQNPNPNLPTSPVAWKRAKGALRLEERGAAAGCHVRPAAPMVARLPTHQTRHRLSPLITCKIGRWRVRRKEMKEKQRPPLRV